MFPGIRASKADVLRACACACACVQVSFCYRCAYTQRHRHKHSQQCAQRRARSRARQGGKAGSRNAGKRTQRQPSFHTHGTCPTMPGVPTGISKAARSKFSLPTPSSTEPNVLTDVNRTLPAAQHECARQAWISTNACSLRQCADQTHRKARALTKILRIGQNFHQLVAAEHVNLRVRARRGQQRSPSARKVHEGRPPSERRLLCREDAGERETKSRGRRQTSNESGGSVRRPGGESVRALVAVAAGQRVPPAHLLQHIQRHWRAGRAQRRRRQRCIGADDEAVCGEGQSGEHGEPRDHFDPHGAALCALGLRSQLYSKALRDPPLFFCARRIQ